MESLTLYRFPHTPLPKKKKKINQEKGHLGMGLGEEILVVEGGEGWFQTARNCGPLGTSHFLSWKMVPFNFLNHCHDFESLLTILFLINFLKALTTYTSTWQNGPEPRFFSYIRLCSCHFFEQLFCSMP